MDSKKISLNRHQKKDRDEGGQFVDQEVFNNGFKSFLSELQLVDNCDGQMPEGLILEFFEKVEIKQ